MSPGERKRKGRDNGDFYPGDSGAEGFAKIRGGNKEPNADNLRGQIKRGRRIDRRGREKILENQKDST